MTDPIVTIQQGRSTWQGPRSAIPLHLLTAGGRNGAGRTPDAQEGTEAVSGALCAFGGAVPPAFLVCERCGTTKTDEELDADRTLRPYLLSCCPERKMRPVTRESWDALRRRGRPAESAVVPCPPIQAQGYDIEAMVSNLKADPEWAAMHQAGDVKLYFMNEADALAMRFPALEGGAA